MMVAAADLKTLNDRAQAQVPGDLRWKLLLFAMVHVGLGLLVFVFPPAATLHALATLAVGLWLATFGNTLKVVAYAGGYLVGAEVFWRMARANLPWEIGKYGVVLFFIVALFRLRTLKATLHPLMYFAFLLPSVIPVLMQLGLGGARKPISFNLSGPLALLVCAWFFSRVRLNLKQFQHLSLVLISPVLSIGVFVLLATLTNPDLVFSGESNRAVTGGFGPNQVSAALGAGALIALIYVLYEKENNRQRLILLGLLVFFIAQSAITFSRGGLYNMAGAALLAILFLLKDARTRVNLAVIALLLYLLGSYVVLPQIDAFTGGALQARFESVDPTGRVELLEADLRIWSNNPILGVGPGQATALRDELTLVAHTEFSRLLSEHGLFGFAALIMLLAAGWKNFNSATSSKSRALVAALMGWSFLFMLNAAMRMAAPSFFFGLAFATFQFDGKKGGNDLVNS